MYRRRGVFIVERVDTTVDGIPFATADLTVLPLDTSPDKLGHTLVMTVDRARVGLPALKQDDWEAQLTPLLDAAGVSSWRTFVRGTREVAVFAESDWIDLLPTSNLGSTEGFEAREDLGVRKGRSDIRQLGAAVIGLLEDGALG